MNAYNIRECFVAITPNFADIALRWLYPPAVEAPSQADNNPESAAQTEVARSIMPNRRFSVASGRNMFEVDGRIVEVGFDRLQRIKPIQPRDTRAPQAGPSRGTSAGPSREVSEVQNSISSTSNNEIAKKGANAVCASRQSDAMKSNNGITGITNTIGTNNAVPVDSGNFEFPTFPKEKFFD